MSHRTLPVVLVAALAGPALAQTAVATVNDPKSHGTLGDAKLSLEEAIRYANDDLFVNQLSAAERAQITGTGPLAEARIGVPTITLERLLTPIVTVSHSHVHFHMMSAPALALPAVIDGTGFDVVLTIRTNHAELHGLVIQGGKVGVDGDSSLHYHPGEKITLHDVEFMGQTEAGLRLRVPGNPPGQQVPVLLEHVHFMDLPIAIDLIDAGSFGSMALVAEHLEIVNCKVGIQATVTAMGGISTAEFFRSNILGAENAVVVRRPNAASDGQWFMRFVHGVVTATRNGIDVQGSNGETVIHHHHLLLRGGAGPTDHALITWPRTARFDVHGSENVVDGNVTILANRSSRRIWQQNTRYTNGTFTLDNEGTAPELQWNVFESVPLVIPATSRTPFTVKACEFVRSPIAGNSTLGALTLDGCYLGSSPLSGSVTNNNQAPGRWLGRSRVVPAHVNLGQPVYLSLDLQPGIAAVWLLGDSMARPQTTNYPFRYYLDLNAMLVLPGVYTLMDTVTLMVPNVASLRGAEFYAQPVTVPTAGQSYVPAFLLPPGGVFQIE